MRLNQVCGLKVMRLNQALRLEGYKAKSSLWLEGYEVRVVYTLDFIPEGDNPNLAVG